MRIPAALMLIGILGAGVARSDGGSAVRDLYPSAGASPSAASETGIGMGTHGWIALPEPTAQNAFATVLAHVPPRSASGGSTGAEDGVLFPATRLEAMPAALAATGDRVYLLFGPEGVRGGAGYRVLSLQALPTPVGGMYAYEPRGRLEAHPSLLRAAELRGFVGTARGPVALLHTPGPTNEPRIMRLEGGSWVEVGGLPLLGGDGLDVTARTWIASVGGTAVVIGLSRVGELSAWELRDGGGPGVESPSGARVWPWSRRGIESVPINPDSASFFGVGRSLFAAVQTGSELSLWTEIGATWSRVASRDGVGSPVGVLGLGDVSRVVAVWLGEKPDGVSDPTDALRQRPAMVWELSGASGLVMHDGAAARHGPLSSQDLRALIILLLGSTAAVLLFVIRVGEDPDVLTLPQGAEIASASRRVAAGIIDLSVALGAVWAVTGAPPGAVLDVLRITPEGMGVVGLIDLVAAGFAISTVMEGVFGRTVGKMLAGCEVLAVVERKAVDRRGVGLGRAAIRNAVRWGLPPAALLGVFEPGGRHRGDVVARTVVVSRFEPEGADGS